MELIIAEITINGAEKWSLEFIEKCNIEIELKVDSQTTKLRLQTHANLSHGCGELITDHRKLHDCRLQLHRDSEFSRREILPYSVVSPYL
jgi:hypothetical protein